MAEPHLLNLDVKPQPTVVVEKPEEGGLDEDHLSFQSAPKSDSEFSRSNSKADVPSKELLFDNNLPLSSNIYCSGVKHDYDLQLVQLNEGFYGSNESDTELFDEDFTMRTLGGARGSDPSQQFSNTKVKDTNNVINRLSTMFSSTSQDSVNGKHKVLYSPENIRLNADIHEKNIDMASAIYSENAVTKEDNLSYHGYTIRTEGADLCINSVIFNPDGNKLRIIINTAEYEQFYRGTVSRIKSEPKIILDEDKWTMLYGSYDDDGLGVVEIEVPDGVSVGDIQCEGPIKGVITIDVPKNWNPNTSTSNY